MAVNDAPGTRNTVLGPMLRKAVSRRDLVVGGLAVGGAMLAGSNRVSAQSATPGPTRVVETTQGPVEIPTDPKRVVSIDSYSAGTFFDIGYEPLAVLAMSYEPPLERHRDGYAAVSNKIGRDSTGLDLEAILNLQPDLIVGISAPWATDVYDQLAAIAPTVLFDYTVPDAWMALAEQAADAIGRKEGLNALIEQYDDEAAMIAETYADTLATTKWGLPNFGIETGQWRLYLADSNPGAVVTKAGVQLVAAAEGETGAWLTFSLERLNELDDADVLLTWTAMRDGSPDSASEAMVEHPVWQHLKAVQNGNFFPTPFFVPTGYGEAIGLLETVEAALIKVSASS